MRGKAAARFEGATLAGLGIGFIVAPKLFDAIHEQAFYLNAAVYAVALLIFWFGVSDPAGEQDAVASPHVGLNRYVRLVRSAHVLLLAPTWIAVNASIGLWFSQSLYQFSRADDRFPDQVLMAGYDANQITVAAIVIAIVFGIGLLYWGNRFKNMRRTTIILYGILGGGVLVAGGLRQPDSRAEACSCWLEPRRRLWDCWPTSRSGSRPTVARSWASIPSSSRSGRSPAA